MYCSALHVIYYYKYSDVQRGVPDISGSAGRHLLTFDPKTPRDYLQSRDGKIFQRASNAGGNFFLARVKFVPNFTLFVAKVSYVGITRFLA